jgi:hypothetical protein
LKLRTVVDVVGSSVVVKGLAADVGETVVVAILLVDVDLGGWRSMVSSEIFVSLALVADPLTARFGAIVVVFLPFFFVVLTCTDVVADDLLDAVVASVVGVEVTTIFATLVVVPLGSFLGGCLGSGEVRFLSPTK